MTEHDFLLNLSTPTKCSHPCFCCTSSIMLLPGAKVIVFPGVGSFGSAMETLNAKGFTEPLSAYIRQDRPFFGICLGMQVSIALPALLRHHLCCVQCGQTLRRVHVYSMVSKFM